MLKKQVMSLCPRVLSVQSHIVYGFVGNKAATFPLQSLGFNVDAINTVTLSNHPGYPNLCKGFSLSDTDFKNLIDGLSDNSLMHYDVIISGYTKSKEVLLQLESTIKQSKQINPSLLYFLDPVLGDNGSFYVPSELTQIYMDHLLPLADVVTPNYFEAETLTGIKMNTIDDVVNVCRFFHHKGVKVCVLKGVKLINDIDNLNVFISKNNVIYRKRIPRLTRNFSGCGDLFSALSLAYIYSNYNDNIGNLSIYADVLDKVTYHMTLVLQKTLETNSKELCIIESGDLFFQSKASLVISDKFPYQMIGKPAKILKGPVIGVIFDMDGTLTLPHAIDFDAMYDRIGIEQSGNILKSVSELPKAKQAEAIKIIEEEEEKGLERMKLQFDCLESIKTLQNAKIHVAIATRNAQPAILKFKSLLDDSTVDAFDPIISRDCLNGINKPNPTVATSIMEFWEINPSLGDVWFVGDSLDDMKCGRLSGCKTCLLLNDSNKKLMESSSELIDLVVDSLTQFTDKILK